MFDSEYTNSWAICIGINDYRNHPKLNTAVNDATEISKILMHSFKFPEKNVFILNDSLGTKENILKQFHSLINLTEPNDRVILFFAGHGDTLVGHKGEIGFLIPIDANNDTSTFIRYDEFMKVSELIPAKHILLIFDACFSGLAFNRSVAKGSSRFMLDMLSRFSRQAIASGKANQPVSDGNGPLPNHSLFAGYLIQGLTGSINSEQNILSASSLMNFLYQKVASDTKSYQTPHFGHFDGDGDFLFEYPVIENLNEKYQQDLLYELKNYEVKIVDDVNHINEKIKIFLSEDKYRIKLEELIISELKAFNILFNETELPNKLDTSDEDYISETLVKLENLSKNLQSCLLLIAYHGSHTQKSLLSKIFNVLCEVVSTKKNNILYKELRWYTIIWLLHSTGFILIYKNDFQTLRELLHSEVSSFNPDGNSVKLIRAYGSAYGSINYHQIIKRIKVHEKQFTPLSEYIFRKSQPVLEDLFFIGSAYEPTFDNYEIIIALEYVSNLNFETEFVWAPVGRFGWKYYRGAYSSNPYKNMIELIEEQTDNSTLIKAGFFKAEYSKFKLIQDKLSEHLSTLNWY